MNPTIESLIYKYLKGKKTWVAGGELERQVKTVSKPSTISRILRRMSEDNLIYKDYKQDYKVRYVIYKYKNG